MRRACAAAAADWARGGGRNQTLLRVTGAPPGSDSAYSVVELIIEDMPFLVDSLSMSLAQLSLSPRIIVHPILRIRRDASGNVQSLQPEIDVEPDATGGVRESWQYWRIDRISDAADCEHLRLQAAVDAAGCAARVQRDWMRMRNAVLKLCNDISPQSAATVRRRDR